jgi:hypothetical protein
MSTMNKVELQCEAHEGAWWGSILVNNHLICEHAPTLAGLQESLKKLAFDLEGVLISDFTILPYEEAG